MIFSKKPAKIKIINYSILSLKGVILAYMLSASSMSLASSGVLIYIENQCKVPITFYNTDAQHGLHKKWSVSPSQRILFEELKRNGVKKFTAFSSNESEEIGSMKFSFMEKALSYSQRVDNVQGNIAIDVSEKSWHSWFGMPSFTVTTCPSVIDVEKSAVLNEVERIIIFGDSVSDTGNLHTTSLGLLPKSPPYYNGMFSNGNVWSALLERELAGSKIAVSNYSVGGANTVLHIGEYLPYTVNGMLTSYEANLKKDKTHHGWNPANHLAIIFMGANDYIPASKNLVDPVIKLRVGKVINRLKRLVFQLQQKGVRKFVFIDLPDLGLMPQAIVDQKNNTVVSKLVNMHNAELKKLADDLKKQKREDEFLFVSLFDLFNELVHETPKFNTKYGVNFTFTKDSCWHGGYTHRYDPNVTLKDYLKESVERKLYDFQFDGLQSDALPTEGISDFDVLIKKIPDNPTLLMVAKVGIDPTMCAHPENYIFWDRVHPNHLIQNIFYKVIKDSIKIVTKPLVPTE